MREGAKKMSREKKDYGRKRKAQALRRKLWKKIQGAASAKEEAYSGAC